MNSISPNLNIMIKACEKASKILITGVSNDGLAIFHLKFDQGSGVSETSGYD